MTLKILTIIGARPQIIKASALSRAIRTVFPNQISEIIVHTGQHYDYNMSQMFLDELEIPQPKYNLQVGSCSHAAQTSKMMEGIEKILLDEQPNYLILYGDTNSTLAGAIAAAKIHIPIAHIEAGLRSFNKNMPEEINRIVCDHASTLLFTPTETGYSNLLNEGFRKKDPPYSMNNPGIFHCGDIMFDNSLHFLRIAENRSKILENNDLQTDNYILATIHRNDNVDHVQHLSDILEALVSIGTKHAMPIVLPLHPRTKEQLQNLPETAKKLLTNNLLHIFEPVSFLDMILLEKNARIILTDSGGVQKEAYFLNKSCVILRPETEWTEVLDTGYSLIAGSDKNCICQSADQLLKLPATTFPPIFGDGKAAEFICRTMIEAPIQSSNK